MGHKSTHKVKRIYTALTLKEELGIIKLNDQAIFSTKIGRKLGGSRTTNSTMVKNKVKVLDEYKTLRQSL